MSTRKQRMQHPAVKELRVERHEDPQLRVADWITAFAGSMPFVYIHAVIFGVWCATAGFGVDQFPFQLLTLIVSLEAIFLSTFVMIGQNRQADLAAMKASRDYTDTELELKKNTHLTSQTHTNTLLIRLLAQKAGITDAEIAEALATPQPKV
jgi:uncharacterized membrane protein